MGMCVIASFLVWLMWASAVVFVLCVDCCWCFLCMRYGALLFFVLLLLMCLVNSCASCDCLLLTLLWVSAVFVFVCCLAGVAVLCCFS